MEKKENKAFHNFSFYESIIFILYLCIGFIPNFQAVDKIAPQWLFMGGLNFFVGIFILKNKSAFDQIIKSHFRSWITIMYLFFIVWAGLSFFYAINPTEVFVNISRQFNVFFMYINMVILLSAIKNKARFFSIVITIILAVEIYFIFKQAIEMIIDSGVISSGDLRGVTANRNVAAFSIALKIPFVLYLAIKSKTVKVKILGILITTFAISALLMIQSRASFIALGLISIMYLIIPFLFYKDRGNTEKLIIFSFVIIPLIISVSFNQIFFASKGADAISRASTISFSTNDGSVNQRLRYYSHVLTHLKSNLFLGVGLGNWKFKSIEYDKRNMSGYIVPYHAHSDFIQLGAELGVLGFLSYLSIFILAAIFCFKLIFKSKIDHDEKLFIYMILLSLGTYFIDANLNFPIARPQVIIIWSLLIALITFHFNKTKQFEIKNSSFKNKLIIFSLLIIALPCIVISFKVYDSLKNQMFLLSDYNSNQYNTSIAKVEAMNMEIPNVTVTTIPLKSLKARYYMNNKQYDKAAKILEESNEANPFLFFTESTKCYLFEAKGEIDSAYYYAKLAYAGLPNNTIHVANFVKFAMQKKDRRSIINAANELHESQSPVNWQNIITAYIDVVGSGNEKLMKLSDQAVKLFPKNKNFLILRKLAYTNQLNIKKGASFANEATFHYNNKNYEKASSFYLKAIEEDPWESSYYENAANSFYQAKQYGNAILYSSKVIYEMNPGTGKSEYLHGISKISIGDLNGGCEFINKAVDLNFKQAEIIRQKYCNN